jgi:hypothetical protein
MNNRNKTLTQIRKYQQQLDITPNDLVYIVDEQTSKSATIQELINYFGKNVSLAREDGNLYIVAKQPDGSNPTLKYNSETKSWQISNDGESFEDINVQSRIATEETLGSVKIKANGGLIVDDEGAISIDENLFVPEAIAFSYSDLSRDSYYENGIAVVKYSYVVDSIKLFELIEKCDGESYYIEPSERNIDYENKKTILVWFFDLEEDETEDFHFKRCTWIVNFGR